MDSKVDKDPNDIDGGQPETSWEKCDVGNPSELGERIKRHQSYSPVLEVITEKPRATSAASGNEKKASSHLGFVLEVFQRHLLLSGVIVLSVLLPLVAFLEKKAISLEKEITLIRAKEKSHYNAPPLPEAPPSPPLSPPPSPAPNTHEAPQIPDRPISNLVFIPNGSWIAAGEGHAWVENAKDGSTFSMRTKPGEVFKMLEGKWIYMWGDSTTLQLFDALRAELLTFETSRPISETTVPQRGRKPYVPLPYDNTPCSVNEGTKEVILAPESGSPTVTMTHNWKHFIDDEYDEFFLREDLPKNVLGEKGKLPDVILISTGLHNCWHFGETGEWTNTRDLDRLLSVVAMAAKEYPLPPIIWVDNNKFVNKEGNPKCGEVFNEYYRSRIMEELKGGGHVGAFMSRQVISWTAPEELYGNVDGYRIHLNVQVQLEIMPYIVRAMKALGVASKG